GTARTSRSWILWRGPRTARRGGARIVITYRRLGDVGGRPSRPHSSARGWVRSGIVAWHVGHAVAGEDCHRGGTCHRRDTKPFFVHLRDCAVELHAFDRDVKRLAQLAGVLAQRRSPHEASRI